MIGFCTKCGAPLTAGSKICDSCDGAVIQTRRQYAQQVRGKTKPRFILIAAYIAASIMVAFITMAVSGCAPVSEPDYETPSQPQPAPVSDPIPGQTNGQNGMPAMGYPYSTNTGDFADGKLSGYGVMQESDGSISDGYGVMIWENGDRCEGNWENGVRSGHGVMEFVNGNRYEGDFENDVRSGYGIFTWADGTKYEGYWEDDFFSGEGIYEFADGRRYEGNFEKDAKSGYGVFTWPHGADYSGFFEDDVRRGQGDMEDSDGSIFTGEWENDIMHGYGVMTYPDGSVEDGKWEYGVFMS